MKSSAEAKNPSLPASWPREDTLTLGIYDMTDRLNSQKAANEAFADAVDVYISRLEEVDPKRAARLRRAIKAGCLEANADELFIGGEEDWLPWVIAGQMPRREDFDDNNLTSDFHFNDQDPEFGARGRLAKAWDEASQPL